MAKAEQACVSARALLALNGLDGACNRAYYAMFDSARAVLIATQGGRDSQIGKTHRGLINAFSEYLVKPGMVTRDMGRLLKRAEELRLIADYRGDSVERADAEEMVEHAATFVTAMLNVTSSMNIAPPVADKR